MYYHSSAQGNKIMYSSAQCMKVGGIVIKKFGSMFSVSSGQSNEIM